LGTEQEGLVDAELADLGTKGGGVSYLEYLDAERQLPDAQLQH